MTLSFDKFERYELPQITLCNPNSRATEVDGKITITDTVGVLSNPKGMNLKLNFDAPHELSFDYYRHKSNDPIKQSFYDSIYEAIQTDRYIYLTDIGYFVISSATDSDEDNIDKKSISLKSCEENELAIAEGLYLKEGTYYLHTDNNDGLIDLFFPKTAGWTIGFIDPSLLTKPYFVEETEVDNGYNFLYTTIQDMFECIVEPDIIRRTISFYSRVYYAEHHLTDIHIAKYNLLKHKTVEENDEDKYTALNVQGKDENLEIRTVNPTGKNIIYNFEPRYSWMSSALQTAVAKWQEKCESVEEEYLALQQCYYDDMQNIVFPLEEDIKVLELQLKEKEQTRDTIIYGDYDKNEYDEIQEEALRQVNAEIQNISTQISDKKGQLEIEKSQIETNYAQPILVINSDCALDITAIDINGNTIFTAELLNELMTHIKPTDYVDEYMLVTDSMTYPQRFEKAKELMDRAQSQLIKISSGQKTYSIDTRSFLFNKQFKHFSEQLCAGAIIYVEIKNDTMEQLHLTGIDINFDEKSTNFTLGNKYDRSDLKALYEDALGQNSKSFSELKYIASIIEDQQKQLDYQRNWVADLRTLTLDNVLTSEDQAIEINNRGLIGRKRRLDENGKWDFDENGNPFFEPEQVKLINNTLVFTKDNWNNASTAVGKIAVGYDDEGNVKYAYGINGQVLIGELILGNNLVLTGMSAGIKIKNSSGEDVFYADDDGNLVLSGTIFATSGHIGGWDIDDVKIYTPCAWGSNGIDKYGTGMAATGWSDDPAFYAGFGGNGGNPWAHSQMENNGTHNDGAWHKYTDFYVTNGGFLRAKNAEIDGTITATQGTIGGWTIDGSMLRAGINKTGTSYFYILSEPNSDNGYIGAKDKSGSWCFKVDYDGHLHATNADISGKITADDGQIGGWTMDGDFFYKANNGNMIAFDFGSVGGTKKCFAIGQISKVDGSWSNAKFAIDGQGKLYATDAYIEGNGTFTGTLTAGAGSKIGGWTLTDHMLYAGSTSANSSYFYILSEPNSDNGYIGAKDKSGSWCFKVDYDGHLHATEATITGDIQAGSVLLDGVKLGAGGKTQFKDYDYDYFTGTTWSDSANYGNITCSRKLTNSGVGGYLVLSAWGSKQDINITMDGVVGEGVFGGKWRVPSTSSIVGSSSGSITSDINKKHEISTLSSKYSTLFDNLHPVTYKYNDGTSGRLHTGFIAQEVDEALQNANIDSKDFAGLVIFDRGTEKEEWTLRYEEFIALNTWQIQRCKKKIVDLENTVAELKTQIQTLTAG